MRRSVAPRAPERRSNPPLDISYALASIRSGALLEAAAQSTRTPDGALGEQMEGLAATLPDLFNTVDPSCLERISGRLVGEADGATFAEILLISPKHTHVIHPLPNRPGIALLAVSPATGKIGLILSAVRAHIDQLGPG